MLVGKFNPAKKQYTAKYEVAAFGRSILSKASNAKKLFEAIQAAKEGIVAEKMIAVKYS